MKTRSCFLKILFCLVIAIAPAWGSTETRMPEARRFMRTVLPVNYMSIVMTDVFMQTLKESGTKDTVLAEIRDAAGPVFFQMAQDKAVLEPMAAFLAQQLTDAEAHSLDSFARSPVGTKFIVAVRKGTSLKQAGLTETERKHLTPLDVTLLDKFQLLNDKIPEMQKEIIPQMLEKYRVELKQKIGPILARARKG